MKKLKSLVTVVFAFAMIFLLTTSLDVHASTDIGIGKVIDEGYTEDGIKYIVREIEVNQPGIVPFIAVSKYVSVEVTFNGKITPQQYYSYNQYDNGFKTYLKGSLPRTSYEHVYFPFRWTTRAVYAGTAHGNI